MCNLSLLRVNGFNAVVAVASMTFVNCLMKRGKRSSSAVGSNIDIGALAWSLTGAPICPLVQLHATASRSQELTTSSRN